ncbi:DUF2062 domain-containing protein [Aquicella lusitana]|uniref:DUF2062 domain-containing protein n=1 Tax=Aquicella lusitana TaxID=254246 RepID=A0A370G768_9COXI|nr:DUF2062 domain-containing protein [Aquicella lusitana]RDI39050.1 hypothetical protein C8D86_1296 [Aquicella lusitana]VVC73657.1 hypothetical protein AQULUS_14040 [Aquicella lusitana]
MRPPNWLKKYIPDHKSLENASVLPILKRRLRHPALWHLNRVSVARGVAIGLFAAMIPVLPFQTLLAIILAILLQANLPIAVVFSWVNNPFTILPLVYLTYYLGNKVLDANGAAITVHEVAWDFTSLSGFWSSFSAWFFQFGKAFFVGLPIAAFGAALAGYVIVTLLWQGGVYLKQMWKKAGRKFR